MDAPRSRPRWDLLPSPRVVVVVLIMVVIVMVTVVVAVVVVPWVCLDVPIAMPEAAH